MTSRRTAISHLIGDIAEQAEGIRPVIDYHDRNTNETWVLRSHDEVSRFFAGLDLVDPGVVPLADWRPDADGLDSTPILGGVARKP